MSVRPQEYYADEDPFEAKQLDFEFVVRNPPDEQLKEIRLAQARAIKAFLEWARKERLREERGGGE